MPLLRVTTFKNEHLHSAQEDLEVSYSTRCTLTSFIIDDAVSFNVEKRPNKIKADIYRDYGISLTYRRALRAKERALVEINGLPDQSYMLVPWLCNRLMETDADTIAKWVASENNRFERLFIEYDCSIKGFLLGARPILYVDGCFLSGPYQGTLLAASTYDADNELFPLAFAIVTIVFDRNNAIIGAVRAIFDGDRHAFCYRHFKENFSFEFNNVCRGMGRNSKEEALKLLDYIAYARHEHEFHIAMRNLRMFSPQLPRWVENQGDVDRWALSLFPFRRWDKITTNLAESFNAWILKERRHNICVLINEHRDKLSKKFFASKAAMSKWKSIVGPNVEAKLKENIFRAEVMIVQLYGSYIALVRTPCGDVCVNLILRECTCKVWQMSGIPCPHACAAIKEVHGNVYNYVKKCYLHSSQEKIYSGTMHPVETHDMPKPNALTVS
ncbi:uncharacterized protein LOC129297283 [Prosopis cineraria]|uniref:uncharacterized protein LOC129297283 n=1 Tax=Prosopis cineraria TaxID=364024 RepID=UPI00240F5870|nr:uncharacterized protein LOC129297283 [Prosopis cineraria]